MRISDWSSDVCSSDLESRLPFYEAYVLMLWRGREESFKTSLEPSDVEKLATFVDSFGQPAFEAWLRRKQRGAFLHFATSLGVRRLPLAGSNIVVSDRKRVCEGKECVSPCSSRWWPSH